MKANTGLLVALLAYNWRGLMGAATVTYSAAYVGILEWVPNLPPKMAATLAGFVAAGTAVGFFINTFKPTGAVLPLQFAPAPLEETGEPAYDLPPPSVMPMPAPAPSPALTPIAPVSPATPAPAPTPLATVGQASTQALLDELHRRMNAGDKV
jgi:hypothetical protein